MAAVGVASLLFLSAGCGRREVQDNPGPGAEAPLTQAEPAAITNEAASAPPSAARAASQASSGARTTKKKEKAKQGNEDIFATPTVLMVEVEVPRSGMAALRRTGWGGGGGNARPTAKATVREGGIVYTNVAVHLKGAAGSFRPVDDLPAMTLNFDKFIPGQSFHGMHKISLNNSVQDPSYLSEKICREMFDAAGVPVPRAGHAIVKLNGRDLGLYVLLEGANKQFLKRYFNNAKGNLYDGGFVRDVDEGLAVNSGDNPNDRQDLTTFRLGINQCARTKNLAPLEKVLDVDRFLSMLAVEVMVWHWDGYGLNKNNWRLFHDLDSDKMVFIPHGLDQTFGIGNRGTVGVTPRWSGMVAEVVMATPEGRRRYRERFGQLFTNVFKADQVLARVDEIEGAVQTALLQYNPQFARNQEHQAMWFKQQIARRNADLARQLGVPLIVTKFGSDGVTRLSGWKPDPSRTGDTNLTQGKDPEGKDLLVISASGNGLNNGFWRTRVTLPPGQYRFEGKVRLKDVAVPQGDKRAGVGLRISKGPMAAKLTGTTDWTDFKYDFQVADEATDVELICELTHAQQGEVWFDSGSLRLVRLP
jgi:hypothetical protein